MSRRVLPQPLTIAVAALLSLLWLAACASTGEEAPRPGEAEQVLRTLSSKDELKARFNSDTGVPRLLLLMSPT